MITNPLILYKLKEYITHFGLLFLIGIDYLEIAITLLLVIIVLFGVESANPQIWFMLTNGNNIQSYIEN